MIHGFPEVVQQNTPAANIGFRILLHAVQFLKIDLLLVAFGSKFGQKNNVSERIE